MRHSVAILLLVLIYIFNTIDYHSTSFLLSSGLAVEGNPVMAWIIEMGAILIS